MLRACACSSSPTRFRPPSVPPSGRTSRAAPRRWRRSGHDVRVVALGPGRRGTLATPARVHRSRRARPRHGSRLAARGDPRALPRPDRRRSRVGLRPLARVPYVLVAHGSDVANAEGSPRLRSATLSAVSGAAAVVCVSESLAARLEELTGPLGPRLHVISAGVDMSRFRPGDREVAAAAVGWDAPGPRICQLGNIVEVKNPVRLLDAFAELRSVRGPARRSRWSATARSARWSQLARRHSGSAMRSSCRARSASTRPRAGFAPRTRARSRRCGRVSGWPSSRRSRRGGRSRSAPGQARPRSCARV